MKIFRSHDPSPHPSSLQGQLPRIRAYGQFNLDPRSIDSSSFGTLEAELYPVATADPDGFTRALSQLVLPVGGLVVYGAARLTGSLLGWRFNGAHYLAMLDAALEWRHQEGTTASHLAPYELDRWHEVKGYNTW